jgi:hypothetical protein
MSPAETWLLYDNARPPEKVGNMKKETFDNLVALLK